MLGKKIKREGERIRRKLLVASLIFRLTHLSLQTFPAQRTNHRSSPCSLKPFQPGGKAGRRKCLLFSASFARLSSLPLPLRALELEEKYTNGGGGGGGGGVGRRVSKSLMSYFVNNSRESRLSVPLDAALPEEVAGGGGEG